MLRPASVGHAAASRSGAGTMPVDPARTSETAIAAAPGLDHAYVYIAPQTATLPAVLNAIVADAPARRTATIDEARNRLVQARTGGMLRPQGALNDPGAVSRPSQRPTPTDPAALWARGYFGGDNSNTQFAVLGLWVAQRHGVRARAALQAKMTSPFSDGSRSDTYARILSTSSLRLSRSGPLST